LHNSLDRTGFELQHLPTTVSSHGRGVVERSRDLSGKPEY